MRGELHRRLVGLLKTQIGAGLCTQESLATAAGMHQTTVGGILNRDKGTFDLDEATAVLEHVGSSLHEFLAGLPPRDLSTTERLARTLAERPSLAALVEDLRDVPKTKLSHVIELARGIGQVTTKRPGAQRGGSNSAPPPARRTKSGPKKRPRVQADKTRGK